MMRLKNALMMLAVFAIPMIPVFRVSGGSWG